MKTKSKKSTRDWGIIEKKGKDGKPVFYARITRTDGCGKKKQFTQKADNKTHARQLRDELAAKYADNGERAIDGVRMNFRELAEDYKMRKLIPAKYHNNRKVAGLRSVRTALVSLAPVVEFFGNRRLKDITPSDLERYKQTRLDTPVKTERRVSRDVITTVERPRAIASVNRELSLLRTILNDAVSNGWLNRSPFLNVKGLISLADEINRERVLTQEEENSFLAACGGTLEMSYERNGKVVNASAKNRREHLRPIVIVALDTAMRQGELLTLTWRDVDFQERKINLLAFNTKTAQARSVGMTARVFEELTRLWENSPKDLDQRVFGIVSNVKRSFAGACRDANIQGFTFHDCRHTAITRMMQAGLSPIEVMKVSGHKSMDTFARYVNPNTQAVQRIADVLSEHNEGANRAVEDKAFAFVN